MKGLYKRIEFKVFSTSCKESQLYVCQAPRGHSYTEDMFDTVVEHMRESLKQEFPHVTWEMVRVGKNRFNVLHHVGHA